MTNTLEIQNEKDNSKVGIGALLGNNSKHLDFRATKHGEENGSLILWLFLELNGVINLANALGEVRIITILKR